MSQKTVKLLKRYARETNKDPEQLKQWWMTLNRKEREKERKRLKREIGEE